ncbi:unnamed protein product [Brugia timori]|uniref:Uncharacterized protein n=1 Tax=Brugia timori TaxID=42155 RepID=A0A0R3QVV8_9BILA|nr:unnamed protein product [Brugia timori]
MWELNCITVNFAYKKQSFVAISHIEVLFENNEAQPKNTNVLETYC